jgi:DNA-damage-inducible protein J
LHIKDQAPQALSMSDAVRLFLRRVVVDQAFPLELKVPNAETLAAMAESRMMMAKRNARFADATALLADLEKTAASKRAFPPWPGVAGPRAKRGLG